MTNNQNNASKAPDHHSDVAVASIWALLLALIVAIEIGSLLMSRSTLTAVLH